MNAGPSDVGLIDASRIARKVAAQHRLETQSLVLSGTHGRILAQDVAASGSTGRAMDTASGTQASGHDPVLQAGDVLTPARVSLCASLGLSSLQVSRQPTVAVFTIGGDPMEPGSPLGSDKAHDSNRELLMGLLLADGLQPTAWPRLPDSARQVEIALRDAGCAFDLILACGAGAGDRNDHVAAVLAAFGQLHCRVRMEADAQVLFGSLDQARLLALPGNAGSLAPAYLVVGRALIDALQGRTQVRPRWHARLTLPVEAAVSGRGYLYAHSHNDEHGAALVRPFVDGPEQLPAMARANALVMLPQTPVHLQVGSIVEVTAFP